MTNKEKILGMIGLASKAGKVVSGMDAVKEKVLKHKVRLVIIAEDISKKSRENIEYICTKNGVKVIEFSTMAELGKIIGKKNRAIVGIQDKNFSERHNKKYNGGGLS